MANFCTQCGSPVADGVRFCTVCGTPVAAARIAHPTAAASAPAQQAPVQQPVYQQPVQQAPVQQPVQQAPVYQQPVQPIQPVYQQPTAQYQPPQYKQPTYQQAPQYKQPTYQQQYQQPVQQAPVYQQPVQPVYQQPVYQQPVQQVPVYQQPQYAAQYAQPQAVPVQKKKRSFANFLLLLVCAGLVYLGIRTVPENLKDIRIPYNPFSGYEDGLDESTLTEIAADYTVLENGGSLLEEEQETDEDSEPFYIHSIADWLYGDD